MKDKWDKLNLAAKALAAVAIPLIIGFLGNKFSRDIKESENRVKFLEIAIGVLQADPRVHLQDRDMRRWAMDLIEDSSGVSVPRAYLAENPLEAGLTVTKIRLTSEPTGVEVKATQQRRGRQDLRHTITTPFDGFLPTGKYEFRFQQPLTGRSAITNVALEASNIEIHHRFDK